MVSCVFYLASCVLLAWAVASIKLVRLDALEPSERSLASAGEAGRAALSMLAEMDGASGGGGGGGGRPPPPARPSGGRRRGGVSTVRRGQAGGPPPSRNTDEYHARHVQTYEDIPIWPQELTTHRLAGSGRKTLIGDFVQGLADELGDVPDDFTEMSAKRKLRAVKRGFVAARFPGESADSVVVEGESTQRIVYVDEDASTAHFAYLLSFSAESRTGGGVAVPNFVIEFKTNKRLEKWDSIQKIEWRPRFCRKRPWLCESLEPSAELDDSESEGPWDPQGPWGPVPQGPWGPGPQGPWGPGRQGPWGRGGGQQPREPQGLPQLGATEKIGKGYGGNGVIGKYEYGGDKEMLPVRRSSSNPDDCYMVTDEVKVISWRDEPKQYPNYKKAPHKFSCNDGNYDDEVNGAFGPLNDALAHAQATVDMYKSWFAVEPWGSNVPVTIYAHANYYVEGTFGEFFQDAMFIPVKNVIMLGDGTARAHPFTVLPVVAHEITHGVITRTSDLIYRRQSGGLNEAFADMAGIAVQQYLLGEVNWSGVGVLMDGGSMRHFDWPSRNGRAIEHVAHYNDRMDVHDSSGIFIRAFHLLSTSPGWDVERAFRLFYEANEKFWTRNSSFVSAACGTVQAAENLRFDVEAVKEAFREVGIDYNTRCWSRW